MQCMKCRLGRIVAWLEELAGLELDRGAHFAPGEGLPRETLGRLQRKGAAQMQMRGPPEGCALVSQLDPDAPSRCPVLAESGLCGQTSKRTPVMLCMLWIYKVRGSLRQGGRNMHAVRLSLTLRFR